MRNVQRLNRLEALRGTGACDWSRDAADLLARLAKLSEVVRSEGDYTHKAEASPAANFTRAFLRGDQASARKFMADAIGGQEPGGSHDARRGKQ